MHSGTGNRNSFPVIQDTRSHSIPDIMPLGSGCGKLWGAGGGGVWKGGAEVWNCGDNTGALTKRGRLLVSQWSGSDRDTIHEALKLSRSKCAHEDSSGKLVISDSSAWEVCQKFICADTTFKRILFSVRYLVAGLESGNQHHGWGHQEGLWKTLLLLQIPGQVPTAASAKPVPQPHQAVCQQG